jgi:hypothetical protein
VNGVTATEWLQERSTWGGRRTGLRAGGGPGAATRGRVDCRRGRRDGIHVDDSGPQETRGGKGNYRR